MSSTSDMQTSAGNTAANGQMDSHWTQEDTFRRAFQDGPIGMAIVHTDFCFAEVNRHLCEMLGYTEFELTGKSFVDITHPDDVAADVEQAQKLFRGEIPKYSIEKRYLKKSGEIVWIQLTATVVRDSDGDVLYGLAMIEDLTERKAAERLLHNLVEGTSAEIGDGFYRALARNLAQSVGIRYVVISECLNHPATRVRTLAFWTGNEFAQNVEYDVRGTPCETVAGGREAFHQHQVQQLFPADEILVDMGAESYFGVPLKDRRGRVLGHFALLDDKSMPPSLPKSSALKIFAARAGAELERKHAEQLVRQTERLSSLGTLAAGMAHEINNPLCAITNAASAALRQQDQSNSPFVRECLESIQASALRAGEITTNLLSFSHQGDSKKQWNDISAMIQQAKQLVQPLAREADVELHIEEGEDLPAIHCNATEVGQVVFNLAANAIIASEKNATVTICISRQDEFLEIAVLDTGIGMTEEQISCIFDPFYTNSESKMGTGLGLSVSYGIVSQHGGTIRVESEPGTGSTFTVVLPCTPPATADQHEGD